MSDVDLYDSSGNYVGTATRDDDAWMGPVILLGIVVALIIAIIYIIAILIAIAAVGAAIYGLVRFGIWAAPRVVYFLKGLRGWQKLEKFTATIKDLPPALHGATMAKVMKKLGQPDTLNEDGDRAVMIYKARILNPETKLHDDLQIVFVTGVVQSVSDVASGQSVSPPDEAPVMPKFSLNLGFFKSAERKRKDAWIAWRKNEATLEQVAMIFKGADSAYIDQYIGEPSEFFAIPDGAYQSSHGTKGTHTSKYYGKVKSRKTGQTGDLLVTFASGKVIGVGDDSGQNDLFLG